MVHFRLQKKEIRELVSKEMWCCIGGKGEGRMSGFINRDGHRKDVRVLKF